MNVSENQTKILNAIAKGANTPKAVASAIPGSKLASITSALTALVKSMRVAKMEDKTLGLTDLGYRLVTVKVSKQAIAEAPHVTKAAMARAVVANMLGKAKPTEIWNEIMEQTGLTLKGAKTYYYNAKNHTLQ